jgi:hypothetical protein
MRKHSMAWFGWVSIVLGTCAMAGCGAAPDIASKPNAAASTAFGTGAVGLYPGESMTFLVKLAGVEVGEAALAVSEIETSNAEQPYLSVHSKINSSGAAALVTTYLDEATTAISTETGQPLTLSTTVNQGKRSYVASATFTSTGAEVLYQKPDDPKPTPISFNFRGRPVHDSHSAMAALRNWRPALGEQRTVYIVGGRRLWRIDLTAATTEVIGTSVGNRKSQRLNGVAYRARNDLTIETGPATRTFAVWMSDDGDRVPLKVSAETELGSVEILLQDYSRP